MAKEKYNIALVCDDKEQNKMLCSLSQNLRERAPSLYVLGENSIPHLSVAHFETRNDELPEKLWEKIKENPLSIRVTAQCYYWNNNHLIDQRYYYTGIATDRPKKLWDFHHNMIDLITPLEPKNQSGINFFPHFTLGCNDIHDSPSWSLALDRPQNIWERSLRLRPIIGKSGLYGRLEHILFE